VKRGAALALAVVAALVALRAVSAPPWPDDWDGIGFVESIARFDLASFRPHPPGYPVYVAMLRVAALVVRDPVAAANAVAVLSGTFALVLLAWAVARAASWERAAWGAGLAALAPLAWRASTAIGSEAPALLFACVALVGATFAGWRAAAWIGIGVGLGLGARLSWAPLFVTLLLLAPRGARLRAVGVAAVAIVAWAAPLLAIVGPTSLVALARTHAEGHFLTWGGTAITRPGAGARVADLARDLFVDGLGVDRDLLGAAIALAAMALAALGLRAWRGAGFPRAGLAAVVVVPYLAWIAFGQNLHDQPRHALPLVVAIAVALGVAATTSRAARIAGAALVLLVAARTARDAYTRRTTPPAGAQLVDLARALPAPTRVAVFGGPSARFFEIDPAGVAAAMSVGGLGDVRLALGRLDSLPARVLVTSELDDLARSQYPLVHVATLCRPPRIDRRAPCLDVYDWRPPFLPAR
jgi:hypothetical protein